MTEEASAQTPRPKQTAHQATPSVSPEDSSQAPTSENYAMYDLDAQERINYNKNRQRQILNRERDRTMALLGENIRSLQQDLPPAALGDPVDHKADETVLAMIFEQSAMYSTIILRRLLDAREIVDRAHRYGPILEQMDLLTKTMEEITQHLAILAVEQGIMTRRSAAQTLGVHENTVARWVKESKIGGRLYGLDTYGGKLLDMLTKADSDFIAKVERAAHMTDRNGTTVIDELLSLM